MRLGAPSPAAGERAQLALTPSAANCAEKEWKRMVTKVTFVGPSFTRKAPKYERFIRPTGLRFK